MKRSALCACIPFLTASAHAEDVAAKLAALKPGHATVLGEAEVVGEFNEVARRWRLQETYEMIHELQPQALIISNHHTVPFPGEDVQLSFDRDVVTRSPTVEVGHEAFDRDKSLFNVAEIALKLQAM